MIAGCAAALAAVCAAFPALAGAKAERDSTAVPAQTKAAPVQAVRVSNGGIRVDGSLDEPDWERAAPAEGFVQHEPYDGSPATERTTVRALYDDRCIYVGVKAYDSEPGKIVGHLTRRDNDSPSDWIYIGFDSYNDKRSAFMFGVNAAGTKQDVFFFNDTESDGNWDAVWDVGTRVGEDGWTAEFAIPWSQLRFANNCDTHSWGFQAGRQICRRSELSFLYYVPKNANQLVSLFGRIEGIERIPPPSRLELLPYAVGSVDAYGDAADDPFRAEPQWKGRFGTDLKYRLTTDVTVDMTINPDFGQVEQDPSEFNLTAYESYFEEKRPFFMEGANIFQYRLMFGDNDSERLFYSRRIGRAPQLSALGSSRFADTEGLYEDAPRFAAILGAAKITGKTSNGVSIGVLEAVTDKEEAAVELPNGERVGVAVEPMTNYLLARAQKDLNDGRSTIGAIATSVVRDLSSPDLRTLNRVALAGGIDFSHRWRNNEYAVNGRVIGSRIEGSTDAIAEAQTSPARYFQRSDADYLDYDPARTSLDGYAVVVDGGRYGGKRWNFLLGFMSRSPGFEVNDIGYMQDADEALGVAWAGYRLPRPWKRLKNLGLNWNFWRAHNYGGDLIGFGGNANGWFDLTNNWGGYAGIERSGERLTSGITRGGPLVLSPGGWNSWFGAYTDSRRAVRFGLDGGYRLSDEGFEGYRSTASVTIRPSGRFEMRIGAAYSIQENDAQYIDKIGESGIIGHLDMEIMSVTARLNYTITPGMSLQFYGMPFVAAGRYRDFREVVSPRAGAYEDRFAPYDYLAAADSPDFNFKQMRSNLVYRWEWSPGSALYLVWSRGATDFEGERGEFAAGRDLDRLFSAAGDNTVMVKISKWLSI